MVNLKTPDQFIKFLKEKKVYRQFKEAVKNNNSGDETDIDLFLKNCDKNETMVGAFSEGFLWADTEEGFSFWNELDTEWHTKYYEDYK